MEKTCIVHWSVPHSRHHLHTGLDIGTRYRQTLTKDTPSDGHVDGQGRRMEDCVCALESDGGRLVLALADGHGSVEVAPGAHIGGFEASRAACQTVAENPGLAFSEPNKLFQTAQLRILRDVNLSIDQQAFYEASVDGRSASMLTKRSRPREPVFFGTTLTAVAINGSQVQVACVGDSSVWFFPDAGGRYELSRNHDATNPEEVARMLASGSKRTQPAGKKTVQRLPRRFRTGADGCALTRSLGHFGNANILQTPDVSHASISSPGWLVLGSDGIWDFCPLELVQEACSRASAADSLCDTILSHVRSLPGTRDNAAVLVCRVNPTTATTQREEASCCVVQ